MLLGLIAVVGLGLRVAIIASAPVCDPGVLTGGCYPYEGDSIEYFEVAASVANGDGYQSEGQPTAHHPPAYPTYLAAFNLVGVDTVNGLRYASALLGGAVLVAVGLVGRVVGGRPVGLVAAALAAFYPSFWINDVVLMSEPMSTLAACLCMLAGYRFWRERTIRSAALLGLAGGFAGLCRGEGPLIVAVITGALVIGMAGVAWPQRAKLVAVVGLAGMLTLAPWVVRNQLVFEESVFITSTSGQSLFLTNRPRTYYGPGMGSKEGYRELGARTVQMFDADQSEVNVQLTEDVRPFMRENIGRLPVVVLARFGRGWNLYRPFDNAGTDALIERRGHLPSLVGLWYYWTLLPLALAGGVTLFRRRVVLSPMLAVVGAALLASVGNFGATRYRAGAEVAMVVLAAITIVAVAGALQRRFRPEGSPAPDEPDGVDAELSSASSPPTSSMASV